MVYRNVLTPPAAAAAGGVSFVFKSGAFAAAEADLVVRVVMFRKNDVASGRGTDEIVEEIVDHLRPWRGHKSVAAITAAVNHNLELLLKLTRLQTELFDRAQNRAHAKKLDGALSEVEKLLASAPGLLAWFMFDPLPPITLTQDGELLQVTQSIENVELAYRARAESFSVELKRLRKVCAHAVDPGFATHPNYDQAKGLCARSAFGLMQELSDGKITGTKDSAFRVVAGLLYEAVSGKPDADLKRACDFVLQNVNIGSGTD